MRADRPVKQRYYPKNPAMQRVIDDQVNELLAAGQIEPSKRPYSAPIVLVRKKNDEWRVVGLSGIRRIDSATYGE